MRPRRALGAAVAALVLLAGAAAPAGSPRAAEAPAPATSPEPAAGPRPLVHLAVVDDVIHPIVAEYVGEAIAAAEAARADALVIELDTPGGLVSSMRDVIKAMLASDIPVVVYVGPSGARAASAGAFITIAAHVAAMAPGTNIGAASPVALGGEIDEAMRQKVVNDAAAYIEGLARQRGRNADWAIKAVREAVSISAEEAVKLRVIDFMAANLDQLLEKAHGRTVETDRGSVTLSTRGARVEAYEMRWNLRFLSVLANPNLAYLLLLAGLAGIAIEFYSPGGILPGVAGAIALILAMLAFQTLPINWAGLLLILLGCGLLVAEIKIVSHGILTVGGIVALTLGSIMLFDSPLPYLRASLLVIIPTVLTLTAIFLVVIGVGVRAQYRPAVAGAEGLIGEVGEARSRIAPEGKVFVHGEYWNARSATPIEPGQRVRVTGMTGLTLEVEPADLPPTAAR